MTPTESYLRPVGFGKGEPDLMPAYHALKQWSINAALSAILNAVIVVAAKFFSLPFHSVKEGGAIGLSAALFASLSRHTSYPKSTFLLITTVFSTAVLGKEKGLPALALATCDYICIDYFRKNDASHN